MIKITEKIKMKFLVKFFVLAVVSKVTLGDDLYKISDTTGEFKIFYIFLKLN